MSKAKSILSEKEALLIPTAAIEEVSLGAESESALAKSCDKDDGLPRLSMQDIEEGYVTLKGAKALMGIAHLVYVRRLVKQSDLEGIKIAVGGSSRWLITRESIVAYQSRRRVSGTSRNYTLRIDPELEAKVRKLLEDNDVEYELELSYTKKAKGKAKEPEVWATVIESLD